MSNYDLIEEINSLSNGLYLEKIEGYPIVGEIRSNAHLHPIQYRALTNCRPGIDDDSFEGIGWTPGEALRDLRRALLEARDSVEADDAE